MVRLEDLTTGTRVRGIIGDAVVATVEMTQWFGEQALKVIFRDAAGNLGDRLLYRDDEAALELVGVGRPWSFDGDGEMLRLVAEAYRIHLAWLFDPYVAITTSVVEPLPHQITAVYEAMLPRQPLRYLLADDPGAGKTIMAGLYMKELLIRGDLERCLIVAPGSLVDQWQDELSEKFGLDFELFSREMVEAARTGNPFEQKHYLIARMDQLSRSAELQARLESAPEWDLIVCDEAHRMSAHFQGGEIDPTKRYRLGQFLGTRCRNLLLMTATPHNGKEEDFQLFLALLDGDRFEGRFRDGVHTVDPSDLMRRMVKEDLRRFDGSALFPERRSYTPQYELSDAEAALYREVTEYVREEMNRADRFADEETRRRINVGFALMTLQRRLASSPEAIFRSLQRRRERLESRLRDERLQLRGAWTERLSDEGDVDVDDDLDEMYEEAPQEEREAVEQRLVDNATAARTIQELEVEIERLRDLEERARKVRRSGEDAKWAQLSTILDDPLMVDEHGNRRKLVVFSEFRDTLAYLAERVRTRLGRPEAVVEIHGGVMREERRTVVHEFMNNPEVLILIANDAAGEGVNLQRAHLMVNYDLPWNPNRLEQRFGRIHRIGQREVCHLWNLVAKDTREGDVYQRLLQKLELEREALGGKVFDVLGQLFEQRGLRELLMDAIRYGDDPEVKGRLFHQVDGAVDRNRLRDLLERRALAHDVMDTSRIQRIREHMERAQARRLQPHFIRSFFLTAFELLGGRIHPREEGRFEITHVPGALRDRDRQIGTGAAVARQYERICFEKDRVEATPRAELVCPGSPLLDAALDLVLERYGELLKRGAILVDEDDDGERPRLLFFLEHAIQDGRRLRNGEFQTISRRLQFVEVAEGADISAFQRGGPAPYLDYRAATEAEHRLVAPLLDAGWMRRDWESELLAFVSERLVPEHLQEVRGFRLPLVDKVEQAVRARLQKEINYWDHRAQDLLDRERAGKRTRLPARVAQGRAERLAERLRRREEELQRERAISPRPPQLKGGALVVPAGLLRRLGGQAVPALFSVDAAARQRVERIAMEAVMAAERALGHEPSDVSREKCGYDIESRVDGTGQLRFIEVKGRVAGADTFTVSRNEVLVGMNRPEDFALAMVVVDGDRAAEVRYVMGPFRSAPDFDACSVNYRWEPMWVRGAAPEVFGL